MHTRNSYFPNNLNVTIPRRRNKGRAPNIVQPELRTIVAPMEERTMEELLRAPTEGYGEAIVLPKINADHFEIKTNLLQLVQANPFYGRESENPHAQINSFKRITLTLRFRNVPNDVIKHMMFPYSLEGAAKTWMNATSSKTDERIDKLADQLSTIVEIVSKKVVTPAPVKAVEESCVTYGGAHSWYNCLTIDQASVCATTGFQAQNNHAPNFQNQGFQNQPFQVPNNQVQQEFSNDFSSYKRNNDQMMRNMQNQINSLKGDLKNEIQNTIKSQQAVMMNQQTTFQNNLQNMICGLFQNQASTSGTLPSNTIPNPKGEMKAITTRSGVAYEGPSIPTNPSPKKEPDVLKTLPKTTPIPKSDVPKSLPKPNIPYPSRRDDQKSRDKALNQMEKIFQIFQDLRFDISFADALLLMPRFAHTIKSLLMNKEKLLELAKILLNENCSAMLLKKLPEKLGDPGKFLIPFRNFRFPTDFVVVDFEVDPRVHLILGRSFLRTSRALIDVYKGELVLRDGNEQITFHVEGTSKHPQKHVNKSIKMVNDSCKDSFKRFTNEPALVCSLSPEDANDKKEKQEVKNLAEPTAKRQTRITSCLNNFKFISKESIFHSNKTPQVSSVFAITSTLPSIEPKDSLIMGDEHLSTFSAKEIVPIPRESEDTSRSDSKNVLPSCDDLSSINVPRDDSMTFSNPLFEFDVNFNSSDINPLFDEVLDDIECKDSYDSNLDESTFLVTPLSDSNKDECLTPGDDIEILLHHDPSTSLKSVASILEGFVNEPPFEENDDLFDLECKTNDWKRILYDAPIDKAECFDPGGDNDEIDAFLAIEVPTYIEEGYYDSEGDVLYLESLLNDDNTHNFSSDVFFDHESLVYAPGLFHGGDVIAKLPHPTTIKGVRSFLGHAGFYRRFIQDFSKIARPMTHLLEKETPFVFSKDCIDAFQTLKKRKLPKLLSLVVPDWNLPFEILCVASDFAISAVLGLRG
ncbi:reverse transcriptase domain-containing protein [Tanacetum coccineum]